MSTDANRFDPTWDRFRYTFNDDWFSENGAAEDVTDLLRREYANVGYEEGDVMERVEYVSDQRPLREAESFLEENQFTYGAIG